MRYKLDKDNPKQVENWVARELQYERGFGDCTAIGVRKDGLLVAGIVYHNWSPEWETIELSGAATDKRWMTRPIIHGLLEYPFSFCQMVIAQHSVRNPARDIWKRLGAQEYVIRRLHGRHTNAAIATLTKEAWQEGRWYNGKIESASTA